MSATVTSQETRQPVTRFAGAITAVMLAIALAALIGIAVSAFVLRDNAPVGAYDPTAALRIHTVREYGSSASYDATGALSTHVVRENGAGAAAGAGGALFDHVLRENQSD
jgi:hypothetical protein